MGMTDTQGPLTLACACLSICHCLIFTVLAMDRGESRSPWRTLTFDGLYAQGVDSRDADIYLVGASGPALKGMLNSKDGTNGLRCA
jgi:hypothetical protein